MPRLGSRTSPYLQAKLVLLAAEHVFAHVPPLVESLLGIRASTTQVYRRTQAAAQALSVTALDAPRPAVSAEPGPVHGMVDGPMLFTDTGWQEVKVGRIFQHSAPASAPGPSHYVAQRGPFASFIHRFEQALPPDADADQVFVTDGAQWIYHWLQERYPHATLILDFHHVAEKLAAAAQASGAPPAWLPPSTPASGPATARPWNRPWRPYPAWRPRWRPNSAPICTPTAPACATTCSASAGCSAAADPSKPPTAPCSKSASNEAASAGPMTDSTASCACAPP